MTIRFGILAGVSSDIQVQDKASIPDQINTCRRAIQQLGGVEVNCFTMDGYSRTGYDSLADAMNDIPPLKEAIESAEQNAYDVLILDNWDRLGDLGQLVHTRFKRYRKQLFSARQSSRLHDPETYTPYMDESAGIDMHIQGILQSYRINKLRRGWGIGMPKRVENGLTPLRVPFGYRWVNKKSPPELEPQKAALILQMADLLLQGRSMNAIAQYADQSGIAPPNGGDKWDASTIRYMLANPYYAGVVGIHRTKYIHDPKRKNKHRPIAEPYNKWVIGQGKHERIWDEVRHRAIVYELDRRRETNKYYSARFPLSGLLTCSECRGKLHRRSNGHGARRRKVLSCAVGSSHISLEYEDGLDLVINALSEVLSDQPYQDNGPKAPDVIDHTQAALEDLAKLRRRVQVGYESGIYNQVEAAEKLREIEKQVQALDQQTEARRRQADIRAEFTGQIQEYLPNLSVWIREDDPAVVNRILSALFRDIIIHPDHTVDLIRRT